MSAPESRLRFVTGLVISGAAAAFWLAFGLANGPTEYDDTPAYLRLADALQHLHIVTSARTPGYPLLLIAGRALTAVSGMDFLRSVLVLQVVLLSGVTTYLVYDLGFRLSRRIAVGALAALLVAADADVQNFTGYLLSESLTVTLAVLALWLRLRDDGWRRAGWVLAYLALTRPNYVLLPFVFAALTLVRVRRLSPALQAAWPTAAVLAAWWLVVFAGGGDPFRPQKWFVPMHAFGKVYEQDLWMKLPDGPERRLLAGERARGRDPYHAREALERLAGPGSAWRLTRAAIRADRLAYVGVCASTVRRAFRQASFLHPAHPRARWLRSVGAWRAVYRGALYASFPFFLLLLAGACANGLGWPDSREAFRWVLMPFTAVVLLTTAVASMGYWDVGRLSLGFHPVNAVLWALLVVRVCDWLWSAAGGAVQRQPPGACIGPSRTPVPTQAEHRFRAARTP